MNIKLIVVSKTDVPYVQSGIDEYVSRLKHYCPFDPCAEKYGQGFA